MGRFKSNQKLLFKAETVYHLKPLEKNEILFSFLDTLSFTRLYPVTGRPSCRLWGFIKSPNLQKHEKYLLFF
ncbi:MAG: hypothetical protein PHS21_05190 [Atribacterota bacterium]|jgi:hypothetical protein|nr:hypothetical protein [Atribacterota bacterium]